MIEVRGKRVLVVGLGRSGHAAALCLQRRGARVMVSDAKPPAAFAKSVPELLAAKIGLELGVQRPETFLAQDLVVVSPGVPWELPQLQLARERNIPVIPEIELASWYLSGPIVGITGTNGKTTTTALLGKMLQSSGLPVFAGGNIGVPLSSAVDQINPKSIIVAELSSFQLEAIREFRPHVAILLNFSPNHLDRHPTLEAYAQAKRQIFRNQQAEDYAILNADDPFVLGLSPALTPHKVFFSRELPIPCGLFVSNGNIVYRMRHMERVLLERRDIRLRGDFNLENVMAAAAAACILGADFGAMRNAVREFRGVEHRLEYVCDIQGVAFYNNSKATSVEATVKSLEAFRRGVHLILGGKDKGAPYAPLRPLLRERVKEALLIGAAAERIAKELAGATELVRSGTLEAAVAQAFKRASPGDVVLLAPACSSFDQFQNYEHRGRVFKELVARLAEGQSAASESAEPQVKRTSQLKLGTPLKPDKAAVPAPVLEIQAQGGPFRSGVSQSAAEAGSPWSPEVPQTTQVGARPGVDEGALDGVPVQESPAAQAPLSVPAGAQETTQTPPALRSQTSDEKVSIEARRAALPIDMPSIAKPKAPLGIDKAAGPQVSPPDEPILLFQTSAEEFPPGEVELAKDYLQEMAPGSLLSPHALRKTEDELLPYESQARGLVGEVSPTAVRDSAELKNEPKAPERKPANAQRGEPKKSDPDSVSQPKLPGMD